MSRHGADTASPHVVIGNEDLTARIDPFGAELLSLRDRQGREFMTDGDPAYWSGHAPLLFPIVGRLKGDVLRVEGTEFTLPQHGFARRMPWTVLDRQSDAAVFLLQDNDATRAQYPFGFRLTLHYTIDRNRLSVQARVTNTNSGPLPFSFGFHPAFAWPLPDGGEKTAHQIAFERTEPDDIFRLDSDGLIAERENTPVTGGVLPLHPDLFDQGALIWDGIRSRRVTYRSPSGPWLEVCHDLPHFGLWQKPGGNFICIEPWAGLADTADFTGEFANKRGIVLLPPDEEARFAMDIIVHQP